DRDRESAQGVGKLTLRRGASRGRRTLRCDRFRPRLRHRVEGLALVRGVPLYGGDEIGNEIGAPFELDVDVRPRVLRAHTDGNKRRPESGLPPTADRSPSSLTGTGGGSLQRRLVIEYPARR